MDFSPEFVSVMAHQLTKHEILNLHNSLKAYTRKVSKKADLIQQLTYLLYQYEILYNRLLRQIQPDSATVAIDKTKLASMTQNELIQIHGLFRRCLRYTNTKRRAINNILEFAKQVQYFIHY